LLPASRPPISDAVHHIISPGTANFDVLRKCGNPDNIEAREEVRIKREPWNHVFLPGEEPPGFLFAKELVTVEEWEYNLVSGRLFAISHLKKADSIKIHHWD